MEQPSSSRNSSGRMLAPATILFLAANPAHLQSLQLGEECRAIEEGIQAATFREQIRFCSKWAARVADLMRALNEHSPSILHFCGHGSGEQGLCFQSENGRARSLSADGLAQVMEAAGTGVVLVVLNACYSEAQAQALVSHVSCVIGASSAIQDSEATAYAATFYQALAYGKSVGHAHRQGVVAVQLYRGSGELGPNRDIEASRPCTSSFRLLTRPGIDADSIYFVGARRPRSRCVIVVKATVTECTGDILGRITDELRELTGDGNLEIKYIEEGSVRLTVELTPEAARRLSAATANGRLARVGGFAVSTVQELLTAEVEAQAIAEQRRKVAKYRRERQIVRGAIEGGSTLESDTDLVSLESICIAAEPSLRRAARRLTRSDEAASDLIQDTFETALRRRDSMHTKNPKAWLMNIMKNLFVDRCRAAARSSVFDLNSAEASVSSRDVLKALEAIPDDHGGVLDEPDVASYAMDEIQAALNDLEPPFREVTELFYFQGKRYDQIAESLNIPIAIVGTRLHRARRKLRALLAKSSPSNPTSA